MGFDQLFFKKGRLLEDGRYTINCESNAEILYFRRYMELHNRLERMIGKEIGNTEVAELLEQTLEEEKAADEKLSEIAEDQINQRAAA